ncbi:uncharacterized protein [Trachinotus anak]|uniref:uncharacterized protein isoform X9 n=1 Tax=Trachinotus anak TaxID=443729 RepID=UPI0039F18A72
MKVATMTTKKQIAETLKILSPEELDKFKSLIELEKGFPHSSRSRLKVANVQDVVELVVQTYRQDSVEVTKKVLKKMNRTDLVQGWSDISAGTKDKRPEDDQRPALIQKVETTVSVIELLLETLADLSIKKLREFKQILRIQIHRYRPHSDIPWSLFRMADLQDTVFLMVQTFGQQSVEKTKKVLKKMTRTELVRRLSDSSSGPTKKHSVDEHLSALIHKVATMVAVKELILETLTVLNYGDLEKFKWFLQLTCFQKDFPYISWSRLGRANRADLLVEVMVETCGQQSVEVTNENLKRMNRTDLVQRLSETSSGLKATGSSAEGSGVNTTEGEKDERCSALIQKEEAMMSVIELLLEKLADLSIGELRGFNQVLLSQIRFDRHNSDIPWNLLMMVDLQDTVLLMVQTYSQESVEKTKKVLKEMNRTDLVQRLTDSSSGPKKKLSVDERYSALIQKVATIAAVEQLLLENLNDLSDEELQKFKKFLRLIDSPWDASVSSQPLSDRVADIVAMMVETYGHQSMEVTKKIFLKMNKTNLVQSLSETSRPKEKQWGDEHRAALFERVAAKDAVKHVVLETLNDLNLKEFSKFKWFLQFTYFQRGLPQIPRSQLVKADSAAMAELIVEKFGQQSVEVIREVFTDINKTDLVQTLLEISVQVRVKHLTALLQKDLTITSVQEKLLETLEDLSHEEFKIFKWFLQQTETMSGLPGIPKSRMEMAQRVDVLDLMVQAYGEESVEVTREVLMKINRIDLEQRLSEISSGPRVKQVTSPLQKDLTITSVQEKLLETLDDLTCREFEEFKWLLQHKGIPRSRLEMADRVDTVDLMVQAYGEQSVEVTREVLMEMNRIDLEQRLSEISSGPKVKQVTSPLQKDLTMTSVQEKLLETLEDLSYEEFKKFKWFLQQTETMSGLPGIPKYQLEMAQRVDVLDLIVQTYGEQSVEVTREVFMKINRIDLEQRLSEISSGPRVKHVTSPLQKDLTMTSVQEKLLETLEDLTYGELEEFRWLLQHKGIPRSRLEMADRVDIVDLMVQAYGEQSVEVTREVLMEVNRIDLEQRLSEISSGPKGPSRSSALEGCRSTMQESSDWTKLEPEVNSTDVDEAPTYSLQSEAGHFECSVSALRWVCKEKVSLKYQFFSWEGHMERMESRQYMAAGPLMNITVIAGKLDEVYLPHWICIDDNPTILDKFAVLHIDDCGDVVEKVSEVTPSHVKLSEPVFSPRAVLVKAGFPVKTRSYVLIYYKPNIPSLKLHVYVIPKDPALQQTVDKMEISYQYEKIRKPHPDRSLKMKQGFILTADIDTAEICPKELTLRHESDPNFYEVFIENPDRDFNLKLSQSSTNEQVWSHKIQKDDYQNSGPSEAAGPSTGATGENTMAEGEYTEEHFVVKHQLALIDRVKNVAPILDELFVKKVIGREIYETIRKLCNPFDKIREIYPSLEASDKCKDIFYEILTRHEKHLIEDLHNKK